MQVCILKVVASPYFFERFCNSIVQKVDHNILRIIFVQRQWHFITKSVQKTVFAYYSFCLDFLINILTLICFSQAIWTVLSTTIIRYCDALLHANSGRYLTIMNKMNHRHNRELTPLPRGGTCISGWMSSL